MQAYFLRPDDNQKKPAKQQSKRQLRYVQETLQQSKDLRKQLRRDEPRNRRKAHDFNKQYEYTRNTQPVFVLANGHPPQPTDW